MDNPNDSNRRDIEGVACAFCTTKRRITHFAQIGRGDHITIGGQKFMINIWDRQISLYTHHAIVKSVQLLQEGTASVTLIHFYSTPFNVELTLIETTEILNLLYNEIYIVRYRNTSNEPDEIVERAEYLANESISFKYSLIYNNCEHFCHWCSVNKKKSFQVLNVIEVISDIATGVIQFIIRKIKTFFIQKQIPGTCNKTALYLVFCMDVAFTIRAVRIHTKERHKQLGAKRDNGTMCACCCRRQQHELLAKCSYYCKFQVGALIVMLSEPTRFVTGVLFVCESLTLSIPKIRRLLVPPFQGSEHKVLSLRHVLIGDVVSFDTRHISNKGIVSGVEIYEGSGEKRGKIKVIHYSSSYLFGRHMITEEEINIDLSKDRLVGHDYSNYKTYSPKTVVERAQQRIGETKFDLRSNRSCHLCHWAKVNEDIDMDIETTQIIDNLFFLRPINFMETISNRHQVIIDHQKERIYSSKGMGRLLARIRDDVKPGQLIEFKWTGTWHKAISTEVKPVLDCSSKLNVKVVHYGANQPRRVIEETFKFDLLYDDIWIHMFHPVFTFPKEEVIKRARSHIGEVNYNFLVNRSRQFPEEVVKRDPDQIIQNVDEIQPGDAITFYSWGFKHDAIVIEIVTGDSNSGKIKVINYARDSILGTRTIKCFFLSTNCMLRKSFKGYVPYPADIVVKRARSRIGEQRFNSRGNTSTDFVFWSKVVQSPSLVACANSESDINREEIVLLPRVGKAYKKFQIFEVYTWSDLTVGSIVQYKYYWITHQGILSAVDETRKTIKVIHYGAKHLFATRTIIEDKMTLNLKRDSIQMYRCEPGENWCNTPSFVVKKAEARLWETDWRSKNRSWDFCLSCLLRGRETEV